MTTKQIEYLTMIGYKNTQEEGAILEHPRLFGVECFVWKSDKFDDVLSSFPRRFEKSLRNRIAGRVISGGS